MEAAVALESLRDTCGTMSIARYSAMIIFLPNLEEVL